RRVGSVAAACRRSPRREHAELERGVVLVKRDQHLLAVRSKGVGIQLHGHLRLLNLSSFQARLSRIGSGTPFLSRPERVEIDNGLPNACARAAGCPKAGPGEREDGSAEPTWGG